MLTKLADVCSIAGVSEIHLPHLQGRNLHGAAQFLGLHFGHVVLLGSGFYAGSNGHTSIVIFGNFLSPYIYTVACFSDLDAGLEW
jgi:hypothetical protein